MSMRLRLAMLALGVLAAGCSPKDATGPGGDVLLPAPTDVRDPGPGEDGTAPRDLPLIDTPSQETLPDPGSEDMAALDPGGGDSGGQDPGPGEVTGGDPGFDPGPAPDAVAYGRCGTDRDCPEGLVCDVPYPDAAYGFCSKPCNHDSECPPSTLPIPQGCHKEPGALSGWCTSLCGLQAGGSTTCEDWLQCVASQWCLPPSTTTPTKGPGESCNGGAECLSGECIEGENTRAHCALKCASDGDCAGPQGLWKGTCVAAGGLPYQFCIWMCGIMASGATCPGDLQCVGMSVCQ